MKNANIQKLQIIKMCFLMKNDKYKNRFSEGDFISSGTFGVVFKAVELYNSNKTFAIKKIALSNDQKVNLIKECKILVMMDSKYVVKCFDYWMEENYYLNFNSNSSKNSVVNATSSNLSSSSFVFDPYKPLLLHIKMELCYKTLREIIKIVNKELKQKESEVISPMGYYISSELFKELVEGLNYLHTRNPQIIHRDLKPTNILISYGSDKRFVKLADFGLAVTHESEEKSHTQHQGTNRYMAPEVRKSRHYDTKADIYSLGVITRELFNIDDNKVYESSNLSFKMNKRIIEKMTAYMMISRPRPSCDQIMDKQNIWVTNERRFIKQLIDEKNVEFKIKVNSIKESFYMFYIQTKSQNYEDITFDEIKPKTEVKYDSEFRELEIIGFGSFGIVCKALAKSDATIYAIKKVPLSEISKEEILEQIFLWSKLKSERVVRLEAFWIENNYYYRSDELIEKLSTSHEIFNKNNNLLLHIQIEFCYKTLKEIIEILNIELNREDTGVMSPLGYYISSEIFIEILESVDYLHKQNIIHRDLKPSNILITHGNECRFVKLTDLFSATTHKTNEQTHTQSKGTEEYAAPEVRKGRDYDSKADIYSLSVICQDLYKVDINEKIDENIDLAMNYSTLFELIDRMSSLSKNKRPNCEEILQMKNYWALGLNKLLETYPAMNGEIESIEDSFHLFFIQMKLNGNTH